VTYWRTTSPEVIVRPADASSQRIGNGALLHLECFNRTHLKTIAGDHIPSKGRHWWISTVKIPAKAHKQLQSQTHLMVEMTNTVYGSHASSSLEWLLLMSHILLGTG